MRLPLRLTLLVLSHFVALVACGVEQEPVAKTPPPAPPPAPAPPVVSADALPPRVQVEADGIMLAEMVDGRVRMKTTAIWGELLDVTYDDCNYFRNALPVLERQLAPERKQHLTEICVVAPPPEPPVAAKAKRGTALQPKATKAGAVTPAASPTTAAPPVAAPAP